MEPRTAPVARELAISRQLRNRALGTLSGGVSTGFRLYERPVPMFFSEAQGATLIDVDGNTYIDFVCGYGPVVLGHGHPAVVEAAMRAAATVQQLGGQHEGEIELAELLCRSVPSFERVRLSVTGSEAIQAVLRIARAATGREVVVKFAGHYHGWFDNVFCSTSRVSSSEPETAGQASNALSNLCVLEWNDDEGLRELFSARGGEIAALIMEPLPCNGGVIPPEPGFLELARRVTDEVGAVLIFDEVITGFRLGLGGAQEQLGVTPDLTVVAKAMGNGFPISAFGGRADLMALVADNRVIHAGTYNGGGISVAAALATLSALEDGSVHERLRLLGSRLMNGLVEVAAEHGHRLVAAGPGPVFFTWLLDAGEVQTFRDHLRSDLAGYAAFAEALMLEGVRVIPAGRWYLNAAHTEEHVDLALGAAHRAWDLLADSLDPALPER